MEDRQYMCNMSRKPVLIILISYLVVTTALVSRTISCQSVGNHEDSINQDYRVHNLNTNFNYTTIQEAIDAAETSNGHTIFVEEGTYYEHVVVNKSISLIGENGSTTIIDGNHTGTVTSVEASNVNITGFTIQNSGPGRNRSIYVSSSGNNISYNIVINNTYGICLFHSSNNIISENKIEDNGMGVRLSFDCSNNNLFGNNITNSGSGIMLEFSSNNILFENRITNGRHGILLFDSSDNDIFGNKITRNTYQGIWLSGSSNTQIFENIIARNKDTGIRIFDGFSNIIWRNNITNNDFGIDFYYYASLYNHITENNIEYNNVGIRFWHGLNNTINFNNFINNIEQVIWTFGYANFWDNGVEGNYWSNYTGVDSDNDGIGDVVHEIDADNKDQYPLMGMFSSFNTSLGYNVNVISNSTIDGLEYFESNSTIKMYVSGEEGFGFCRVSIPHVLMDMSNISAIIDDGLKPVLYHNYTLYDNGTHRWIYFAYEHPTHKIDIIPEFPSFLILPLFMTATLLAVIIVNRRKSKTVFQR